MKIRLLVTGVLGALVLAGCGAGPDAATSLTRPSIPGVNAEVGEVQVRNAVVGFAPGGYAQGDDAPATLAIGNAGQQPVRLTGLASEGAAAVTVVSATQVGAVSPAPAGETAALPLAVAPGRLLAVTLELTGLRQALNGTSAIPVVLTFDNGVELPLAVPMDTPLDSQPRESAVVEQPAH